MGKTLKITFDARKQKFSSVKGDNVVTVSDKVVKADGWHCQIRADGSIKCYAQLEKDGKYSEINLNITKTGSLRITKMTNGSRYENSQYRMRKWPVDGTIILTGGEIDERKAFFKKSESKE